MTGSVKQPAVLKKRKLSSKQWQQHNTSFGQLGESRAAHYLTSKQYRICEQNVVFSCGEIDLVALDTNSQELVFVEVKTRSNSEFGHPSTALNWKKLRALKAAAQQYLQLKPSHHPIRFDLVVITANQVIQYQNITQS